MNIHKEISFEDEICEYLAAHGWLHDREDAKRYDRVRALYAPDLIEWVKTSQPKAWEAIAGSGEAALLDRVRKQIDARGTLDVLRHGIDMIGFRGTLKLAEFKPALAENPEIVARYQANRLRVVRQVKYSTANENSIDLVLFVNGIPVATAELKTDFTQSVGDAVDQYRYDRPPRHGGRTEPLLSFPSGALVHFAVSNAEVFMTTRLDSKSTRFLPFNKGDEGGAGNPLNPNGHRTSYLWEEVWERESWLELIGRYIIAQKDKKGQPSALIFPRYHQLDATRQLVRTVLQEGPGQKYLIQHSAGSGKTNSIAWSAHFLADLHDASKRKMFDTVIVVSDRRVIDGQLQEAIFSFERTLGVVETIKGDGGSKSGQLAQALADGKKIVVCTIQTFPFALDEVRRLSASQGKTFAVIADEAHSSQTGEAASKLKAALSPEELEDLKDGGEYSSEDILAAQMKARASDKGVTYVAFTATPKAKTMELFGRRPDPNAPTGKDNLPEPFHVYSMRQAIEEGFILDVLQNYTPYSLAFRLASEGKELESDQVERDAAMRGLMSWVRLHPHNISQKVKIVVEHYRANVTHLLDGRAKAMVVLQSRKEAVRWKLAIDKYIKDQGYPIGTLVAFSGEVNDKESGPEPFSETGASMNPDLRGRDIKEAFDTDGFHILLVANKFQTGFDQPLLCAMYVDRRLAGVQAVQTLSRLNRAYSKGGVVKDTTYVLDFSDSSEEVLKAFSQYYGRAELEDVTDPNLIYDLKAKLDGSGHYDEFEVDRVVRAELDPASKQSDLVKAVEPVAQRIVKTYAEAKRRWIEARSKKDEAVEKEARDTMSSLELLKGDMQTYLRVYAFLSQIFDYGNTAVEKRAIFFRYLVKLLEFGREREEVDLSKVVLTHHKLSSKGGRSLSPDGEDTKLKPATELGSGQAGDPEKVRLAEIIERVNDLFEGDLTDADKLVYVNEVLRKKLMESEVLAQQARNNSKEQFAASPNLSEELLNAIIDSFAAHTAMSKQALDSEKVRERIKDILLGPGQLWDKLREAAR
ncbi:Type I restriction-modification system, restriction subunit R [Roseibacterium elongatum DSM 19469]|uniref:Type I restriction-modification system, restriction subunit R n=1 Tax=Roseicyclus elongatus DSM 19469 TaxID=1294273 RepID=W8S2L8_9RHOB|nr:type I restriction endonuclease [Roseibacterium elongatum]AHM02976.1 Type I restriction-modification system, restriction subunit R [Roseibacterium elongatum DSM 19469]